MTKVLSHRSREIQTRSTLRLEIQCGIRLKRRCEVFIFLWLGAACFSPAESAKDDDATPTSTSTNHSSNEALPDTQMNVFDRLWLTLDAINAIYCKCDSTSELCDDRTAGELNYEYECSIDALARDPEGSTNPLKCDLAWAEAQLNCLKAATSCAEIDEPSGEQATCDEAAQAALDACPFYPGVVEDALDQCFADTE